MELPPAPTRPPRCVSSTGPARLHPNQPCGRGDRVAGRAVTGRITEQARNFASPIDPAPQQSTPRLPGQHRVITAERITQLLTCAGQQPLLYPPPRRGAYSDAYQAAITSATSGAVLHSCGLRGRAVGPPRARGQRPRREAQSAGLPGHGPPGAGQDGHLRSFNEATPARVTRQQTRHAHLEWTWVQFALKGGS